MRNAEDLPSARRKRTAPLQSPFPGGGRPSPEALRRHAARLEREALEVRARAREIEDALAAVRACLSMLPEARAADEPCGVTVSKRSGRVGRPVALARPVRPQAGSLPPIRVWMLGEFRISVGDRDLDTHRSTKVWSFLKFLLSRDGDPVSAEVLADTFWRRSGPKGALQSVYSAAHAARRLLGDPELLTCEGGFYALAPGSELATDVAYFRQKVRASKRAASLRKRDEVRAALEDAVRVYAGPFLPRETYARWAAERRATLDAEHLAALQRLGRLAEEDERWEEALNLHARTLDGDRLREGSHRAMIRIFLATGRRAQALRHYRRMTEIFEAELGIAPSDETRALVRDRFS